MLHVGAEAGAEKVIWEGSNLNPDTPSSEDPLGPIAIPLHDKATIRVGRDNKNDLILKMSNVSRYHAIFSASSAGVLLNDLGSTNGTYVNSMPITTPVDLKSGDVVEIGDARIAIELSFDGTLQAESFIATQVDGMKSSIVTVLVADICDYTTLTESLPEHDVAGMLQKWLHATTDVVRRSGGKVDKYIGDCVMAIWRGPDADAGALAQKAAKAALAIKETTDTLSDGQHWPHREQFPWKCRVSLNTGYAMIGMVGGRGARDFTALGDIVNVAFRLDSVGSRLDLDFAISASTAKYLEDSFVLKDLGEVEVKGRKEKVQVFTIS